MPELGPLRSSTPLPDGLDARFDGATLRLRFLADGVLAVTLLPDGASPLLPTGALDPEARRPGPSTLEVAEGEGSTSVSSGAITVSIDHRTGALAARTPEGRTLQADAAPPHWREASASDRATVTLAKALRPGERLLGLGDKALGLDRRGHRVRMWNTDAYQFERGTDPLYKSFPFVLGLAEEDGRALAYGLFVDTHAPATFDLGASDPDMLTVEAEAGALT
jgi:alpha-glucosidase